MCGRRGFTSRPCVIRRKTSSSATYTAPPATSAIIPTRTLTDTGSRQRKYRPGRQTPMTIQPLVTAAQRSRLCRSGRMSLSSGHRHMMSVAVNAISMTRKTAK